MSMSEAWGVSQDEDWEVAFRQVFTRRIIADSKNISRNAQMFYVYFQRIESAGHLYRTRSQITPF